MVAARDEKIAGLEIAVDAVVRVQKRHAARHLQHEAAPRGPRDAAGRVAGEVLAQRPALHELRHKERRAWWVSEKKKLLG